MKKLFSKLLFTMLFCGVIFAPSVCAQAGYVPFTGFDFTTAPYNESYEEVVSKKKADNETNWYVTFTSVTNAPTSNPAFVVSAKTLGAAANQAPVAIQLGAYSKAYNSSFGAKKDDLFSLFASGNANNGNSYYITMTGRYTS